MDWHLGTSAVATGVNTGVETNVKTNGETNLKTAVKTPPGINTPGHWSYLRKILSHEHIVAKGA
jgi:hypothetical protein